MHYDSFVNMTLKQFNIDFNAIIALLDNNFTLFAKKHFYVLLQIYLIKQ